MATFNNFRLRKTVVSLVIFVIVYVEFSSANRFNYFQRRRGKNIFFNKMFDLSCKIQGLSKTFWRFFTISCEGNNCANSGHNFARDQKMLVNNKNIIFYEISRVHFILATREKICEILKKASHNLADLSDRCLNFDTIIFMS